nr:hypothetical protein [Xanthomonas theicola]
MPIPRCRRAQRAADEQQADEQAIQAAAQVRRHEIDQRLVGRHAAVEQDRRQQRDGGMPVQVDADPAPPAGAGHAGDQRCRQHGQMTATRGDAPVAAVAGASGERGDTDRGGAHQGERGHCAGMQRERGTGQQQRDGGPVGHVDRHPQCAGQRAALQDALMAQQLPQRTQDLTIALRRMRPALWQHPGQHRRQQPDGRCQQAIDGAPAGAAGQRAGDRTRQHDP